MNNIATSENTPKAEENQPNISVQQNAQGSNNSVAGHTTDHINLGNPNKDEQIEVRTPNFARQHVLHLLILFGLLFVVFTFVFQVFFTPVAVVGRSMVPTLNVTSTGADDEINTDIVYSKPCSKYVNGDIIITDEDAYPGLGKSIIKRVIATEGQTLTFKRLGDYQYSLSNDTYTFKYTVWLNGVLLDEPYILDSEQILSYNNSNDYGSMPGHSNYKTFCEGLISEDGKYETTIKTGYVFVMGDNRNISQDSRYFGAIQIKHIIGKVVIHIPAGTNFFVGLWNAIFKRNTKLIIKTAAA